MEEFVALVPNIVMENEFLQTLMMKTFNIDIDLLDRFNGVFSFEKMEEKKKLGLKILEWARKLAFRRYKLEDRLIRTLLLLGL